MTSYFSFTPSRQRVPSFAPTLDGAQYQCSCTWNVFGQRYYLNCHDLSGALIFSRSLVDTPLAAPINALSWSGLTGRATAITQSPHGYAIGSTVTLTIEGAAPSPYNGAFSCLITGASSFTFLMASDPGQNVTPGNYSFMINLAAGYFTTSTLVYRAGQFEVAP